MRALRHTPRRTGGIIVPMDRYAILFYGFRLQKLPPYIETYLDKHEISIMDYWELKYPNEVVGVHCWNNPRTGEYEDFIISNFSFLRTPSIRENAGIREIEALPVKNDLWDSSLNAFCAKYGFTYSEPKWFLLADVE